MQQQPLDEVKNCMIIHDDGQLTSIPGISAYYSWYSFMFSMRVNREIFRDMETSTGFIRSAISNLFIFPFHEVAHNILNTATKTSVVCQNLKSRAWLQIDCEFSIPQPRMKYLISRLARGMLT